MFITYRLYKDADTLTWKSASIAYDTLIEAEKNYYKLLAADIDDENKIIALVFLIDSNANIIKKERFSRE